ncbi:MAG: endonuclease/exonuclease/phosphatase family protein [Bacteroidota bacterium]
MRKLISNTIVALAIVLTLASCSNNKATSSFTFAFYNVENLFDTIDDPNISDEKYLPESKIPWNSERFDHKLDNLSRVMKGIDTTGFPALFGLCEVENIDVLEALINHTSLQKAGYNIIHKDSPDGRGIDVALLYNPKIYSPIKAVYIKPVFTDNPGLKTRDILYSKGVINNLDTLHVFINHWVSRWGGQEKTEPNRIQIAKTIKRITDSILNLHPNANILIAGDLNDNPTDLSISEALQAKEVVSKPSNKTLYNLSLTQFKNGEGSLYYKSWDMFDQIIVSTAMLTGINGLKVNSQQQSVYTQDWMLYQPKEGPARPSRTAAGRYYGGFSDHLPVYIGITN